MLFLDWEKAFDKIHPEALLDALTAYGIQAPFVDLIKQIYSEPLFSVKDGSYLSPQEIAHTQEFDRDVRYPHIFFW